MPADAVHLSEVLKWVLIIVVVTDPFVLFSLFWFYFSNIAQCYFCIMDITIFECQFIEQYSVHFQCFLIVLNSQPKVDKGLLQCCTKKVIGICACIHAMCSSHGKLLLNNCHSLCD